MVIYFTLFIHLFHLQLPFFVVSKFLSRISSLLGAALVNFTVPKQEADGFINNKKEQYKFQFDYIFPTSCTQEDVFDVVAKPVAERCDICSVYEIKKKKLAEK